MEKVFHIISKQEADTAKAKGFYQPPSLINEGFIHCSYPMQVCRVANFLYKGQTDLMLLEIDKVHINCEIIDEDLYASGELFPHIYGQLPWSAVLAIHEFPCNDDGMFELPITVNT